MNQDQRKSFILIPRKPQTKFNLHEGRRDTATKDDLLADLIAYARSWWRSSLAFSQRRNNSLVAETVLAIGTKLD